MQYTFRDKTEQEKDKIIDVLDKYCVPYTKEVYTERTAFGIYYRYNITVDLNTEDTMTVSGRKESPLCFILNKVDEALTIDPKIEKLNILFDTEEAEHPPLKDDEIVKEDEETNKHHTLFEDLFKPNFGIDKSLLPQFDKKLLDGVDFQTFLSTSKEEASDIFKMLKENVPQEDFHKITGDFSTFMKYIKEHNLAEKLSSIMTHHLKKKKQTKVVKDKDDNFIDVTYDELPSDIKELLRQQASESELRSSNCRIRMNGNRIKVEIRKPL